MQRRHEPQRQRAPRDRDGDGEYPGQFAGNYNDAERRVGNQEPSRDRWEASEIPAVPGGIGQERLTNRSKKPARPSRTKTATSPLSKSRSRKAK